MLGIIEQLAIIMLIGIAAKILADRINFPDIVVYILIGTVLSTYGFVNIASMNPIPELLRTFALIVVVFTSAFYLRLEAVQRFSKEILLLSTIGVLITALVITFTTAVILPIPILAAAFLGVLLCGTDPAALSESISEKRSKISAVLSAESLFNQPFTIILPLILLEYIVVKNPFLEIPGAIVLLPLVKLALLVLVGVIAGFAFAYAGKRIINYMEGRHEEIIGLMLALGSYSLAQALYGSGVVAVAVCGILLTSTKIPERHWFGEFNKELAFMFTMFVFIFLGAEFSFEQLLFERQEIVAIVLALFFGRLISTSLILKGSEFSLKERSVIGLVAPKGIAPAALAPLLIEKGIPGADEIVKIVYVAIILSILLSLFIAKFTILRPEEKEVVAEQVKKKKKERLGKKMLGSGKIRTGTKV
jgi:cell volume regulation protein A